MRNLILFVLVVIGWSTTPVFSQEEEDHFNSVSIVEIKPKHSFQIEVGMPIVLANKFQQKFMDGLIHFSPYYQYSFDNHLAIAGGIFYNYHRIKSLNTYENLFGGANTLGAFFKISHDKFHTTRFGTDIGAKIGLADMMVTSNKLKLKGEKSNQLGVFVEPTMAFILTVAEKSSFRLIFGYRIQAMPFTNRTIGMDSDNGMSANAFRKVQQYLTVGFGYTFYAKTRL